MDLAEEIKSKFRNEYQKAFVNIRYTNYTLSARFQSLVKQNGITAQQYNILRILRGQHPEEACIGLLKERMLDKSSDVSRIIDRLFSKKLVERNECKEDRRQKNVKITQSGLDLLAVIDKVGDQSEELLKNLSSEEVQQLNVLLDKIRG